MRRKGVLKKLLGALCVGILLCMPVTAKAAEQEEIVGRWTGGGWATFIFYDNGTAFHDYGQYSNTRAYTIESGSLTVTDGTGSQVTLSYDLWRGEKKPGTEGADEYNDAVLFQVIEPGKKMKAWNVVKRANESEWKYGAGEATITKVNKADSGSKDSGGSDSDSVSPAWKCEHNYAWIITTEPTETENGEISYMCVSCGDVEERQPISADVVIRRKLLESIKNAEAGATVTFDNGSWLCYPKYVLDALKEKGDVSLRTDFAYEGKHYSFTIPAGSDYANLEEAEFYGFLYLFGVFDGVIVE